MACYYPMLAVPIAISPDTGKVQYRFREKLFEAAQLNEQVSLNGTMYPVKALPCGKCIGCRLDYSKEWAIRCTLEMQDHSPDECYFVTLTYDEEHVPYSVAHTEEIEHEHSYGFPSSSPVWHETVERPSNQTLDDRHLQLFMKLLRRYQEYHYGRQNIRFFACGEYGGKTYRPHYHLIIYGLKLSPPSNDCWQKNNRGYMLWESDELEKIWKKGHVIVGHCTYETCGYVARYMLKKQKGNAGEEYKTLNILPPFSRMSRMPGIGLKYYEAHKEEMLASDEIYLETEKRGIKSRPPRFFEMQLSKEYPDIFEGIKDIRSKLSLERMMAKENRSGLPISIILQNEEIARSSKTKILLERNVGDE